jgi:hypothetical protein
VRIADEHSIGRDALRALSQVVPNMVPEHVVATVRLDQNTYMNDQVPITEFKVLLASTEFFVDVLLIGYHRFRA